MVRSLFEREAAANPDVQLPSIRRLLPVSWRIKHTHCLQSEIRITSAPKVRRMCDSRYLPPDTKSALTQTPLHATSPLGRFMAETFLFSAPRVTSRRPHPSHFLSGFMWQQVAERQHVTPAALMSWPINLLLSVGSTSGWAASRSAQLRRRRRFEPQPAPCPDPNRCTETLLSSDDLGLVPIRHETRARRSVSLFPIIPCCRLTLQEVLGSLKPFSRYSCSVPTLRASRCHIWLEFL